MFSGTELGEYYRWRLVVHLFAQRRSLLEGSVSLAAVLWVCRLRRGWPGFSWLIGLVAAITVARVALAWYFERSVVPGVAQARRTPEYWGWLFTAGAVATAVAWAVTDLCVIIGFDDPMLQMFVVMVQAGWVSAAGVRNAASPATVILQTCVPLAAIFVSAAIAGHGFTLLLMPCCLVMMSATLSISAYLRQQAEMTLLAEQRLEEANVRLTQLSDTDGLTDIHNRRAFDNALQAEWGRAAREASDVALLMIDVDQFKRFNDQYGHPAGDDCLRLIASVVARTMRRPPDMAARFGGEEFVALLPGTDAAGAREVAERVREAVLAAQVPHEGSPNGIVTVSIGAASMAPTQGCLPHTLIELADQALYAAKQAGRNQVRLAGWQLPLRVNP